MIIADLAYRLCGIEFFAGLLMQNRCNLATKTQDHKSPDQRKINHVWDDRIKASEKKHGRFLGL
jgi:hypothetical protein